MSLLDVHNELQQTMPALISRQKNPMATISTILSRLVEYGQATVSVNGRGQRAWLWVAERESSFSYAQDENDSQPST